MTHLNQIAELLSASLEDYSISRSERMEIRQAFRLLEGDVASQARTRSLAFRLATRSIQEIGEVAAMEWLEGVIKLLYSQEQETKSEAYFSPGEDCLHRIRRFIAEAQHTLDICVFTITDDRIVERLIETHQRGVKIRIISDDDKSEDLGSDIDRLSRHGICCRYDHTPAHMHHKFAIADGIKLLNGSYNWTRSAAAANCENITVTNHTPQILAFQEQFNLLWKNLD